MKFVSVVGARPQFVKAAVVSRALRTVGHELLVHTGQHYDDNMSRVFFDELGVPPPDVHLGVGSGGHAEQTGRMMLGIETILLQEKPDWLVVYGDTNSTLAGALAAAKLQIPVAHVEAGLRSFNRAMPEEINRVLTDHCATALFCPTGEAAANLMHEGVSAGVNVVGDVMYDVLLANLRPMDQFSGLPEKLGLVRGGYALATLHRAGNTDDPLRLSAILGALNELGLPVVFPLHPRTRKVIQSLGIIPGEHLRIIEPVGYLDMLQLEAGADAILTDSGGIQKEAYWLGVRCITLRDETEWVETVQTGWNRLAGADSEAIKQAVRTWRPAGERPPVYGDGHAAEKIAKILYQSTLKE